MRIQQNKNGFILAIMLMLLMPDGLAHERVVQLAVSSAIQAPLTTLCHRFSQVTPFKCKIHAAPTGHLYAQIMHGMSYDIFISTQEKYIQALIDASKADPESRFVLAIARIVLWGVDPNATGESLHQSLIKNQDYAIAMANPGSTPYGEAAREVLQEHNLWNNIQDRLIYGYNLQKTYDLVASQQVPLGFVSLAQLSPGVRMGKHYWEPDPHSYKPVIHEAVMLKSQHSQEASLAFMLYLHHREACEILEDAGYRC